MSRLMMSVVLGALVVCAGSTVAVAQEEDVSNALTIYSTASPGGISPELYRPVPNQRQFGQNWNNVIPGYAIVKQERPMGLAKGRSSVRFTDVAAWIEPTTVSFKSLTDPDGTQVLEQNFEFDLVSTDKLMQRFLDKEITVIQARGNEVAELSGKLLSTSGGLVLQGEDGGIEIANTWNNVRLPELPGGLITKPTLVWDVLAKQAGDHRVRVTYETKAMTWWADYNIIFTPDDNANKGKLDVSAWVSIINQSGAGYPEAKLKLIAGDVNRAPQPRQKMYYAMESRAGIAGDREDGFQEKSFFEYHLYTLGRPTTLPDNSTKQIELFETARNVPCEKVLVYYGLDSRFRGVFPSPMTDRNFGNQSNKKVDTYLRLKNSKDNRMGMPLPSGRIRVSQRDLADDSLEFIGEDVIDHTPKDEEVLILLGQAFDVVGERTQMDFKVDNHRDWMEETIEIKLRNHKEQPVRVIAKENLYRWTNWEITESTHKFDKIDARTIHFPVDLPAGGEATIKYTVKYTW